METIIVTRHPALLQYLQKQGLVSADTPVFAHADASDVQGKHVIGVLPMRLAAAAAILTEVSMTVPAELRGQELTLEQIESLNPTLTTYAVKRLWDFE